MQMKLILENWRTFLMNEKLMLKPGPNGWDKYCELVAEAYAAAPAFEDAAVPHFEAMKPFVDKMFKRIEGVIDVHFVEEHPYANADELRQDVEQNKIIKISTLDAEHEIFDNRTNAKFRAIHDYMSHIQRNTVLSSTIYRSGRSGLFVYCKWSVPRAEDCPTPRL
jgi:hypothetical protein